MRKGGEEDEAEKIAINNIHDVIFKKNPKNDHYCFNINDDDNRKYLIDILNRLYKSGNDNNNTKIYRYIQYLNIENSDDRTSFINDGNPSKSLTDDEKKLITYNENENSYKSHINALTTYINTVIRC